jgi:hypothetical protein|tara:strand:+ start:2628 stop:2849 length:222 start_codon:yes stop_codon:yes gene_type:complete
MKQGYNARLDESLGARNGKKSQSMKSRRDESKGMSKKMYGHSYGADKSMSYRHSNHHHVDNVGSHIHSLIKKK